LGLLGWAGFSWMLWSLAWLLLLFPAWGLFFLGDAKLVNDWRSRLFDAWVKKEIEFRAFCDAVNAIPTLPRETLQTMLATLPSAGGLPPQQFLFFFPREGAPPPAPPPPAPHHATGARRGRR